MMIRILSAVLILMTALVAPAQARHQQSLGEQTETFENLV
jgi:hypothetical protein